MLKKVFLNLLNLTGEEAIKNFLEELQLAMIEELEADDELLDSLRELAEQAKENK